MTKLSAYVAAALLGTLTIVILSSFHSEARCKVTVGGDIPGFPERTVYVKC